MGGAACCVTEDASDIFEMCRLEYGVYRRSGDGGAAAWCSVLTPAMIRVLEYDEDLHYYWAAGYGGDDVSYTPACTLVADVLRHLVYDTHTHTRTHTQRCYRATQLCWHGLGSRNSVCPSVRLSVRPFVTRLLCD